MRFFSRSKTLKIRNIEFQTDKEYIYSKGLESYIHKELKIYRDQLSLEQLKPILQYLVEFIQDEKPDFYHGETLSCFSWSILLNEENNYFELFEIIPEAGKFRNGLGRTLQVLNHQLSICTKLKTEPCFPLFDQTVKVDPLVKTGLPANLFRWDKKYPDSGWVAITSMFDEKSMSFEVMTLGQFMTLSPEAIPFMALPSGYKVIWQGNDAKIGYDGYLLNKE